MGNSRSFSSKLVVSVLCSFFLFSLSVSSSSFIHGNLIHCLSLQSQNNPLPVYTPKSSNYSSILISNLKNLRFFSSTSPKPQLIITPLKESHVQAAVVCSRKHGIQIKIRSGGHDYEGLSSVSDVHYVILDMSNLRSITIDVEASTAWVQSGATLGELYYRIAEKSSTLAFPGGTCPTVGVGGFLSGGGYGTMLRRYGLAADNVIDARIVDVHGRILGKSTMGEDFFWAIRGGGGGSFGVLLSWKIRLVSVPPKVTICTIDKFSDQGVTAHIYRWEEVAPNLPQELTIRLIFTQHTNDEGEKTIRVAFDFMYLGGVEDLLTVMKARISELGLERNHCSETSWIRSALNFASLGVDGPLNLLLNRTQHSRSFKAKSDYVNEPISEIGLQGMLSIFLDEDSPVIIFTPHGARMSEISESEIPYPHRNGTLFTIQYIIFWDDKGHINESQKHICWIRKIYRYMAPYVSKSPRAAYVNYRDIDLGQSKKGTTTYNQGKVWGRKYFNKNYERLVQVKSKVDPGNFFRHEQSIPTWE